MPIRATTVFACRWRSTYVTRRSERARPIDIRSRNETSYLLLTALAEGESHGYALAQRVIEITDGDVRPGAGTLYSTLERLLAKGYVAESGTEIVDGRARRRYRIRQAGTDAVAKRVVQLQRRVGAMNTALDAR